MTWFEILTAVIGTGILGMVIKSVFTSGKMVKTLEILHSEVVEIKKDIKSIDGRLNRLEGAFFERGQWEARSYKMSKDVPHQKHGNHH